MDAEWVRHAAAVQANEAVRVRLAAEVKAYTDAISAEAALHVLNLAAIAQEALLADLGAEAGAGIAAEESEAPNKRCKFQPASLINDHELEALNYVPEDQTE